MTTFASVQNSVDQIGRSRNRALVQQHGLVGQALSPADVAGAGSRLGSFASVGSQSVGATGRFALGDAVTVSAALFETSATYNSNGDGSARLHPSITVGGSVRWLLPNGGLRPFVEAGGWIVPKADLTFTRAYANGSGVAIGTAELKSSLSYYYGRVGVIANLGGSSRLTLAGELGRERLHSDAYAETLTNQDPFEGHYSAGTDRQNIAKAIVAYRLQVSDRVLLSATGGYSHPFRYRSDLLVTVPGIGALAPTRSSNADWAEYGASVGYRLSRRATVSLFASGVAGGSKMIGHETHAGIGLDFGF